MSRNQKWNTHKKNVLSVFNKAPIGLVKIHINENNKESSGGQ